MTDSEANELRLIANEIMWRLYEAGQRDQLDLLRMYAVRAIKVIDKKPNATAHGRAVASTVQQIVGNSGGEQ